MTSSILNSMQFEVGVLDRGPRSLKLIDGHLLPRGVTTLVATDAGSGKSTSAIQACVSAAATGLWTFLGRKQHDAPLKSIVLLGEDDDRTFENSLFHLPSATKDALKTAVKENRIILSPYRAFANKLDGEEDLFDAEGKPTELGKKLFQAVREFKPDVLVIDTVTSVSACPYMDKNQSKFTLNPLNKLASEVDCAIILMMHLTKSGTEKITKETTANDITRSIAGSAGLSQTARHCLSMVPCPKGKFENIELRAEDDAAWMVAVKTNTIPSAAAKIFPVIRDSIDLVLRTTDENGVPLLQADKGAEDRVQAELRAALPLAIQAASELRSPFINKAAHRLSIQSLAAGPLVELLPKSTESQITDALARLERDGKIVPCTASRAGGSLVWDVPHGAFARETEYEQMTGDKLTVRKGAPLMIELKERMEDLRAGIAEAEMEAVEKKARAAEKEAQKGQVEEETVGEVKEPEAGVAAAVDALDAELMSDLDNL